MADLPNRNRRPVHPPPKPPPKATPPRPNPPAKVAPPVATVATPKEKRGNPRTAKARDARMKTRGRLPDRTMLRCAWDGVRWVGTIELYGSKWRATGGPSHVINLLSDGLFRLMEELDVAFWEWWAKPGDEAIKALLTFAPNPPAPARWESPGEGAGTAPASP